MRESESGGQRERDTQRGRDVFSRPDVTVNGFLIKTGRERGRHRKRERGRETPKERARERGRDGMCVGVKVFLWSTRLPVVDL